MSIFGYTVTALCSVCDCEIFLIAICEFNQKLKIAVFSTTKHNLFNLAQWSLSKSFKCAIATRPRQHSSIAWRSIWSVCHRVVWGHWGVTTYYIGSDLTLFTIWFPAHVYLIFPVYKILILGSWTSGALKHV